MKKLLFISIILFSNVIAFSQQQIFSNDKYSIQTEELGWISADSKKGEYGFFDGGFDYFEVLIYDVKKSAIGNKAIIKGKVFDRAVGGISIYLKGFIGNRANNIVHKRRFFKVENSGNFEVKIKKNEKIYFEDTAYSTIELTITEKEK